MARVALVTRNALLAMGLTSAGHDVVEVRVSDADRWLAGDGVTDVSAVVLDLGDPRAALKVVAELRATGHWLPVLLVASHDPGWNDPVLHELAGVDVLVLPISGPKLAEAAARLLARKVVRPVDRLPVPVPPADPAEEPVDPLPDPLPESPPDGPWIAAEEPAPPADPPQVDAGPASNLLARGPDGAAVPLVRELLVEVGSLSGVPDAATAVAEEAMRRIPSDGAAVLVPDGDLWRVSGGAGLRAAELQGGLPAESWFVQQVALAERGRIFRDTDITRRELIGAPMAAKEHLMAAPIPEVNAAILLGRDLGPEYDEQELAELIGLAREVTPVLSAALATRRLARSLHRLEDTPD